METTLSIKEACGKYADEKCPDGISKIYRYNWNKLNSTGCMEHIDKNDLHVDHDYQRKANNTMASTLAKNWNWVACGTITVAKRTDGEYCVVDGQHRVLAALKRDDISKLPCIVFQVSKEEEALGFFDINTYRRHPNPLETYNSKISGKDPMYLELQSIFKECNVTPISNRNTKSGPNKTNAVNTCVELFKKNKNSFKTALEFSSEICYDCVIPAKIISGMYYLVENMSTDFNDIKFKNRVRKVGVDELMRGIDKAVYVCRDGGAPVYASGMLERINNKLKKPYKLKMDLYDNTKIYIANTPENTKNIEHKESEETLKFVVGKKSGKNNFIKH